MSRKGRAVCTMAHGPHLALLDVTGPALARYAERHGYEAIEIRHRLDPSRPASWDKVVLLHALVQKFELVVWVDADALVLDDAPDIARALRSRRFLHLVEHRIPHGRVPNAGVAVLRGGPVSARFLDRVWSLHRYANDRWWENAAILHLLGYRDRDGMRPVVPSPWRLGFGVLDKAWNSIPADPAPRPHIVHFPGIPLADRLQLLSERRFQ
jgi:hypothetical protein